MNKLETKQDKKAEVKLETKKESKANPAKKRMGTQILKRHLKYMIPEMRLALIKEPSHAPKAVTRCEDLDKFVEPLKHYAEEHFVSFHLNAKFEVIGYQIVSRGTLSASLVHPREVFKASSTMLQIPPFRGELKRERCYPE